jgi:hypothetical protein
MSFPFNFIEDPNLPESTIAFVPPVTREQIHFVQTGETREFLTFNPRQAGIIKNTTSNFDVETKK